MIRLKIIILLIIVLWIGCTPKIINCDIFDDKIIVKEAVAIDLSFNKQITLTDLEFESFFSGYSIQDLILDSIEMELLSPDILRFIPMISTYNEGGVYGDIVMKWEDYKDWALKNASFYYLGTHNLGELKLSLILSESSNDEARKSDRALYMITEGQSQKWVIPVAMSIFEGMESQMKSSTYMEKSSFIYKDYSHQESVCAKYWIKDTGEIVVLNE